MYTVTRAKIIYDNGGQQRHYMEVDTQEREEDKEGKDLHGL